MTIKKPLKTGQYYVAMNTKDKTFYLGKDDYSLEYVYGDDPGKAKRYYLNDINLIPETCSMVKIIESEYEYEVIEDISDDIINDAREILIHDIESVCEYFLSNVKQYMKYSNKVQNYLKDIQSQFIQNVTSFLNITLNNN